jgi:hypothetical protein
MAVPFGMDGNPYGAIDEVTGLPKEEGPVGIYTPEDIISHPSLPGIPGMPGGIRPMPLLTAEQLEALTRPQNVIDESYYQGQIDENTMQVMLAQQQAYTDFYYENEQEQDTEPDWLRELDLSMGAPVNPQKIEAASELVQDLLKGVVISEADAQRVLEMYSSLTPEEMASLGPMMNIIDSIAQTANQQYYGNVYEGEDIYLSNDESDWI